MPQTKPKKKKNHLKSEQSTLGLMSQVLESVLGVCSPKDLGIFLCGPLDNYSYWTTVLLPISTVGKLYFKRVPPMLQSPPRWKKMLELMLAVTFLMFSSFTPSIYLRAWSPSLPGCALGWGMGAPLVHVGFTRMLWMFSPCSSEVAKRSEALYSREHFYFVSFCCYNHSGVRI